MVEERCSGWRGEQHAGGPPVVEAAGEGRRMDTRAVGFGGRSSVMTIAA